jgi:hypothetical protein
MHGTFTTLGWNLCGRVLLGFWFALGGIWAVSVEGAAPPMVSQAIAADHVITDEFGAALLGTDPAASHFGLAVVEGDLVQVLLAVDGIIYPPALDGSPHILNEVLKELRIGVGAAPNDSNPGRFGTVLSPRPAGGSKLFVRVFNAPTLAESTFYRDSQVFEVSGIQNALFSAVFAGAAKALDEADDDGDGVNNSWELSQATNPLAADSDGDGLTDYEEWIAGTDPTSFDSAPVISEVRFMPPAHMMLVFPTVTGRIYRVEQRIGFSDDASFIMIETVTGNGDFFHLEMAAQAGAQGTYRVTVALDPTVE